MRFLPAIVGFLGYDPRPMPASLSGRLHFERERQGLSQRKLAAILGVDPATVASWEVERKRPRARRTLRAIEAFLGSQR